MSNMSEVKLKRWSKEEIAFLKNNYDKMSGKELSEVLNRTGSAIREKARELGFSKKTERWTEEDEQKLIEYFPFWDREDLEAYFNRTFSALQNKARKLKINRINKNKYTIEEVKAIFKEAGCLLLSQKYVNNKTNLRFICECTREGEKVLTEFLISPQCAECGIENRAAKSRHSFEYVEGIFLERGCIPLFETYENSSSKLDYVCTCGNEVSSTLNNFLKNEGCTFCWEKRRRKYTKEYVKEIVEDAGCVYIDQDQERINTYITFICTCEKPGRALLTSFLIGSRCKECGKESYRRNNSGENHPNWDDSITDEERIMGRSYIEYTDWRKQVYIRDNYTCQCCFAKRKLNAHHKDGYHWCTERRTDVENGVTLCEDCHVLGEYSFHGMYGNRNNTEDQYSEWISKYQQIIIKMKERSA